MKTLEEAKKIIANKYGYKTWTDVHFYAIDSMEETSIAPFAEERLMDEVSKEYAKQCLQQAVERVEAFKINRYGMFEGNLHHAGYVDGLESALSSIRQLLKELE